MTSLTRLPCRTCSGDTLHRDHACVHCGTIPETPLRPCGKTLGSMTTSRAAQRKARYARQKARAADATA